MVENIKKFVRTIKHEHRSNGAISTGAQEIKTKRQTSMPFGVSSKKFSPQSQYPPNSENFALRMQFFAQNTYKSWRRSCQNSFSNRKQHMRISNFGLKISTEVPLWPCLRMRSIKLAKTTWNRGPISKISRHIGNRARRSEIWGQILHRM